MPLIYRSMSADGDKPLIGASADALGVRVPPAHRSDIVPDASGFVSFGTGGMSVAPAWRDLPLHRIPSRLRDLVQGARGKNSLCCWKMGEGEFAAGSVAARLLLRLENARHGLVEPAQKMSLDDYQADLAATRDQWVRDEA